MPKCTSEQRKLPETKKGIKKGERTNLMAIHNILAKYTPNNRAWNYRKLELIEMKENRQIHKYSWVLQLSMSPTPTPTPATNTTIRQEINKNVEELNNKLKQLDLIYVM